MSCLLYLFIHFYLFLILFYLDSLPRGRTALILEICSKMVNNIENKNPVRTDISDRNEHSVESQRNEVLTDTPGILENYDDFILMSGQAKKERKKSMMLSKIESENGLNMNKKNKIENKNGQKNVKFSNRNNLGKIDSKKKSSFDS